MDRYSGTVHARRSAAVHPLNAPSVGFSNDTGARFQTNRVCSRAVGVAACRPVAAASNTASSVGRGEIVAPRSKRAKLRSKASFQVDVVGRVWGRVLKVR